MAWEVIYNRIEDKHPKIIVIEAKNESIKLLGVQFKHISYSFLHKIGARAKILPYTHMIRWVVENLSIEDMQFMKSKMELMGSFKAEELKKIEEPFEMIHGCRVLEKKFKYDKMSMYLIDSLENP